MRLADEMRMGLYRWSALSKAKMSKVLVLLVVMSRCITLVQCLAKCTTEQMARASKKNIALVGARVGSQHLYPSFSEANQIAKPCVEVLTKIINVE